MSEREHKPIEDQPLPVQVALYGVIGAICLTVMALLVRVSLWAIGSCI